MMASSAGDNAGRWPLKYTLVLAASFPRGFGYFLLIKKILGQTETRTCDRMYCQSIRTVRDVFWYDRARIAKCSLLTPTDRFKENYCIDNILCSFVAITILVVPLPGAVASGCVGGVVYNEGDHVLRHVHSIRYLRTASAADQGRAGRVHH